ncbi:MAG TPA: twin-arginine translocation signal domain-containing protein [Verrucomicrobiae bacterium]|nr:twin-arginine translocation signal domain-containing protein [Verrucomicrobiae bacterium]
MIEQQTMTRRDALKTAAAIGVTAAFSPLAALADATTTAPAARKSTMIAIATAPAPFARQDVDKILDDMQARAGVNAVFPFMYTHGNVRAGLPAAGFRGGNYAIPHMEYYKDCGLTYEDMRGTEFGDVDVLARMIPAAHKHGVKVFTWIIEDNERPAIPHWEPLYSVDLHGRRSEKHPGGPCYNNPMYRAWLLGLVEDYSRSYEIDGIMWGSERQGPLFYALGAYHGGGKTDPGRVVCFCEYCEKKAKGLGIDVDRAKKGFGELETYVRNGRAGIRPRDGYFVAFWRLLLKYPELLAWDNFWVTSRHEFQADVYRKVKSVKPSIVIGWHTWQNLTFSPFHRAEEDFAEVTAYSDFLRPVPYSNCAAERMKTAVDSMHGNVFGDVPPEQTLEFLYRTLDYQEVPYNKLATASFSPDYVFREVKRALDGVAGSATQIWPGVDIDVPVPEGASHCTPESVKEEVLAVFKAGAPGVFLSRNYVEMKPENLSGAGAALRELGKI